MKVSTSKVYIGTYCRLCAYSVSSHSSIYIQYYLIEFLRPRNWWRWWWWWRRWHYVLHFIHANEHSGTLRCLCAVSNVHEMEFAHKQNEINARECVWHSTSSTCVLNGVKKVFQLEISPSQNNRIFVTLFSVPNLTTRRREERVKNQANRTTHTHIQLLSSYTIQLQKSHERRKKRFLLFFNRSNSVRATSIRLCFSDPAIHAKFHANE